MRESLLHLKIAFLLIIETDSKVFYYWGEWTHYFAYSYIYCYCYCYFLASAFESMYVRTEAGKVGAVGEAGEVASTYEQKGWKRRRRRRLREDVGVTTIRKKKNREGEREMKEPSRIWRGRKCYYEQSCRQGLQDENVTMRLYRPLLVRRTYSIRPGAGAAAFWG